jgi:hypothetical protein
MSKKRRQYSAEFKLDTVMEGIRGEKPIAQLCRERNISDSLYHTLPLCVAVLVEIQVWKFCLQLTK